ncbi:hypothetical protein HJC23_010308 [Cyclotella cryptica]|uniref:Helicase-associated domain-containing protein n=1 Tax=Cyclotella cryptica TaxID=29204 RepID=A0ABD3QP32_9STRA
MTKGSQAYDEDRMKTVMTSTFTVRTDVPHSSAKTHPSGILHASQPDIVDLRQKHVFVWISDLNFIQSAVHHLSKLHYKEENLVFIPFSSKQNWLNSYPYAIPSLDCDDKGNIVYCQTASAAAPNTERSQSITAVAKTSTSHPAKKKRGGPRITKSAVLTNDLRDELHIQIYNYFRWLLDQLNKLQLTSHGRVLASECGSTALGVRSILSTLESVFGVVKSQATSTDDTVVLTINDVPLLEQALEEELGQKADERLDLPEPEAFHYQKYDFDELFEKLVEYRKQNGHCNVPIRYKDDRRLGKWISKLREKKRELSKSGEEYEPAKPSEKLTGRTLTRDRIERLDSIGFQWRVRTKPTVCWESRFQELISFYKNHGRWPLRWKSGSLGQWTHNQRNLYAKRDKYFMNERFSRLEEIGFDWDPTGIRAAKEMSWEDGLEQLVSL